ncbi:MAG: hypothetical protein ABJI60_04750 [Kangiellaceae bacterium]
MASKLKEEVLWSSEHQVRRESDRREGIDRRQYQGRSITVPDMRAGNERRSGADRREKVRLTITGRAMDI